MELIDKIVVLERAVSELIKNWERFFSGLSKVPPMAERDRIASRLRLLAEQTVHRRSEQFRIEQLQHRFMTYSQNWERMLRAREEGRGPDPHAEAAGAVAAPSGVNAKVTPPVDEGADEELFERYIAAKKEHGLDVRVDRDTFEEQIAVQRRKIEERTGRAVRFDVQVVDGKVRVVARKAKKKP
jgi:hypothetical protein